MSWPIANGGGRRQSIAVLASSLASSFADPSPFAQEVVSRDIADLDHNDSGFTSFPGSLAVPGAAGSDSGDDNGVDWQGSIPNAAPYLYRRPSAIAYGTSRGALGIAMEGPPPVLSRVEKEQSRNAERSLLRDNHLLPPKRVAEAAATGQPYQPPTPVGFWAKLYKQLFSTRRKVPGKRADEESPEDFVGVDDEAGPGASAPTEQTALLAGSVTPDGEESDSRLEQQWEAAVAAGQIHTTWQREAKTIGVYSRSLIITFLLQYSINITAIFAVGHIGKIELGAVSLATMTANITFYAPVQGLATCLDTLCAQAFGSGHKTLVGLQLQRMVCFLLVLTLPLAVVWLNAEALLNLFIPEPETTRLAGLYLRTLVISMPFSAVFECSKRYMQAQGLFTANTYVLFLAAPFNIFLNWLFVWHLGWGYIGAPISACATQILMPVLLFLYVVFVDGSQCWGGFSKRVLSNWAPMVRLALPGMIMIEAEYFAFEILTLVSGRFGSTQLAAQSILVTITSTTYQIPFPMSIAASTRIANLIGAKLPDAARTCAKVAVVIACIIGVFNFTLVAVFRYQIANLFTDDQDVIDLVAISTPVCAIMQVFDGMSAVASGILRGVGRQEIGGYANLAAYYIIALPISFGTAIGLGWQLPGLWLGVTIGLFLVAVAEFSYLSKYNWRDAVADAERRNASG